MKNTRKSRAGKGWVWVHAESTTEEIFFPLLVDVGTPRITTNFQAISFLQTCSGQPDNSHAQRFAFFPQPDSRETGRWECSFGHFHLVRDVEGRGGIQSPACWLVQQVGVSCWTLPSRERQDKSLQDAGLRCLTFNNKESVSSGSPLVGETRQHHRGARTLRHTIPSVE